MVLDSNQLQDLNRLRDAAKEMISDRWISNKASEKLNKLLVNDKVDATQFTQELKKIVKTAEGLNWDRLSSKMQTQVGFFSGIPLFGVLLVLFLIFVFRKRLFSKKTKTKSAPLLQNLRNQVIAVSAYLLYLFSFWATFENVITTKFPLLGGLCPEFIKSGAGLYKQGDFLIPLAYIIILVQFCIRARLPKPRILRFHFIQGLILYIFQTYPSLLIGLVTQPLDGRPANAYLMDGLHSIELLLNLYWILTALYQAVTLSYPKNKFLREALEISLGADEEGPDGTPFKWWDRQ